MDEGNPITAAVFSAFIKCPTKAYLQAIGEHAPGAYFADIETRIASLYKAAAKSRPGIGAEIAEPINFGELWRSLDNPPVMHEVDCETTTYGLTLPRSKSRGHRRSFFVPVLFSPWDKLDRSAKSLVCFGALSLLQVTGTLADTGTVIYGDGYRRRTIKIADHVDQTRQTINAIGAICRSPEPPPLILNNHCAVCDFQPRCRSLAAERDDLSLLNAMTGKERAKFNAKGIFTITQLSYGYRPRRRKRTRTDAESPAEPEKRAAASNRNDHSLRALAIKKNQIHVVGAPSLKLAGVPVFLDVEGTPDKDFYYLVGLRFEGNGKHVERSFWADDLPGERIIWDDCLRALKAIGNPQIVAYGAYEVRFLRQMKERYVSSVADLEFIDRLVEHSINLLGRIYGKIYFPTFSNSLKEIGRYVGFDWKWGRASGAAALLLRRAWELGADDRFKRELIGYNMDDCRAAVMVADTLARICDGGASGLNTVDVNSLDVAFPHHWGRFVAALPEFAKINNAAYWDYQREKIYIRGNRLLQRATKRKRAKRRPTLPVNTTVIPSRPGNCPGCNSRRVSMDGRHRRIFFDMRFSSGCIRRWVVRYVVDHYKCSDCNSSFASDRHNLGRSPYSQNVLAYVVYNIIELNIPQYKLPGIMQKMFGYPLGQTTINRMVQRMAESYRETYNEITRRLTRGRLIHADETHVSVKGIDSYVWVFASMEDVVYIWSKTRENVIVTNMLKDFQGVLISDFYSAYDSIPCPQQKCLIHLMRDLNGHLYKESFNQEIKQIVQEFAMLLKPMIDTIDRFGLKSRFLKKHKIAVTRFYDTLLCRKYNTELATKAQTRLKRNRQKLFTFLDYDNVPWNNNNAEHAVKSFAALRKVIGGTTNERGIRDYLTLLSVCQTCTYRGIDFFQYLRSGEREMTTTLASGCQRSRLQRPSATEPPPFRKK
jgi:predicted RecB family nuclease